MFHSDGEMNSVGEHYVGRRVKSAQRRRGAGAKVSLRATAVSPSCLQLLQVGRRQREREGAALACPRVSHGASLPFGHTAGDGQSEPRASPGGSLTRGTIEGSEDPLLLARGHTRALVRDADEEIGFLAPDGKPDRRAGR